MGIVEIKGDDDYMAEALIREIVGRLKGEKGKNWERLFNDIAAKHGITITMTKTATVKGKFDLPSHFCSTPVVKNVPEMICGREHEWELTEWEETFEARCAKCGLYYKFELYE